MKRVLILGLTMSVLLPLSAQQPYQRLSGASIGTTRQLNKEGHSIRAKAQPMLLAKVAPANTVEVPFTHSLGKDNKEIVSNYTAINVNNDSRSWKYGSVTGYAACMGPNETESNDDWLFTVPIHMPAGDYVIGYEVGMMGSGATAVEMNVGLGTEPTVEGMTTVVTPTTQFTDKAMTLHEYNCTIATEGYYYLGFHCTTKATQKGTLKLTNVSVKAGSVTPPVVVDPPMPGTLEYVLAPKGELKATLTYTAPTKTVGGKDLTEISKVILTSRWEVDKFTFDNVQPGQVITQDVELYAGLNNRFTAVAYVGETASEKIEYKSIFAGPDTPLAPENVKLKVNNDFKTATLTWDRVGEVGEHGGYVDPEAVEYYIFDAFGTYYDPALASTKECSYTFTYPDLKGQDYFAYQVTAGYGENYSLDNTSNISVVGQPDALPFTESFADGLYDGIWLADQASGTGGQQMGTITDDYFASLFDPTDPESPKPLASQDGDNGFYFWLPYDTNVMYGLISVRADISKADKPVLEFWYQGKGNVIEVLCGTDIDNLELIETIDLKAKPTDEWTQARVALDRFKAAGAVMFELRFKARDNDDEHTWSIPLDNIRVRNLDATDVHIVSMSGNSTAAVGSKISYKAHVENLGTTEVTPSAVWTVNGQTIKTDTDKTIAPNGFADYTLDYEVPYIAPDALEISFSANVEGDATPADNTRKATVEIARAAFATVNDLAANANGSEITLTWSAPVIGEPQPETLTEDFESPAYTAMSISGAGGWTVYDGDGQKTYNVFRELYNPYQTQPIAFQLFDNVEANIPPEYQPDAVAHSGRRFMLGVSAQRSENDNWLISPQLSGNAQTVKFWAKSFSVAWPETFEIYYSTGDNKVESFTTKVEKVDGTLVQDAVPEDWTEYKFDLPAVATYFAIHHNSYDTVALFIDDVTYESAPTQPEDLAIDHYRVYCNGTLLSTEPVKETTFVHRPFGEDAADGDYDFEYMVVPVYNHGAVAPSNAVSIHIAYTGLSEISASDIDADSIVYNLSGMRVAKDKVSTGVYIIVKGSEARKVMVK